MPVQAQQNQPVRHPWGMIYVFTSRQSFWGRADPPVSQLAGKCRRPPPTVVTRQQPPGQRLPGDGRRRDVIIFVVRDAKPLTTSDGACLTRSCLSGTLLASPGDPRWRHGRIQPISQIGSAPLPSIGSRWSEEAQGHECCGKDPSRLCAETAAGHLPGALSSLHWSSTLGRQSVMR